MAAEALGEEKACTVSLQSHRPGSGLVGQGLGDPPSRSPRPPAAGIDLGLINREIRRVAQRHSSARRSSLGVKPRSPLCLIAHVASFPA